MEILGNKYALKQMIVENARITDTSATCIDIIFTDMLNVSDSGVTDDIINDNLPIFLIKKKIRNNIKKAMVQGRSYLHYDKVVLNRILQS